MAMMMMIDFKKKESKRKLTHIKWCYAADENSN